MSLSYQNTDKLRQELDALNDQWQDAGRCYHFQTDPPHVLFNLNCPEELETRVRDILARYAVVDESHTQ